MAPNDMMLGMDGALGLDNPNQFPLIPGSGGNPTGAATINSNGGVLPIDAPSGIGTGDMSMLGDAGGPVITPSSPTPAIPLGDTPLVPTGSPTTPTGLPINTGGAAVPTVGTGIQGLNPSTGLGLAGNPNFASSLDSIFGSGFGQAIMSYINNGAGYNPQVAQALINQMLPSQQIGEAAINEAFGAAGSKFSSNAALGLGDFESQFAGNQQAVLANLYNESANRESNVFTSMFDAASLHEANKLSLADKISQGLGLGSSIASLLKQLLSGKSSGGSGGGSSSGGSSSGTGGSILNDILSLFHHNAPFVPGGQGLSSFNLGNPNDLSGIPLPNVGNLGNGNIDQLLGDVLGLPSDSPLLEDVFHDINFNVDPSIFDSTGGIDFSSLFTNDGGDGSSFNDIVPFDSGDGSSFGGGDTWPPVGDGGGSGE